MRQNAKKRGRPFGEGGGGAGMTEHSVEEIPLYLVPHVLRQEIHRLGEGVAEVRIRRTGRHFYHILIRTGRGDAA